MLYKCPTIRVKPHPNMHRCAFCDVLFKAKRSRDSKHVFCSRTCLYKFKVGDRHHAWGKGEKECDECGRKFNPLRTGSKTYGGRGQKYCSKSCRMIYEWRNKIRKKSV